MYHTIADNEIRVNVTSCMKGNSLIERMFVGGGTAPMETCRSRDREIQIL